ncbi:MAG: recombination mediator RecR [Planctomycetota bacterium]|nr:recombination mediator RecR [Planctomycetota bacterium]
MTTEEKPDALARLADNVAQVPGIGRKTAERIAFHVLQMSDEAAASLCSAIMDVKKTTRCSVCCNVVDADPCPICVDAKRDRSAICVVERPADVRSIERATGFRGLYHVLGGHIAPLEGVHAENLTIGRLVTRVVDGSVKEVIIATNPTVEGDLTATYLAQALSRFALVVSRIAKGVPSGSTLDYATRAVLTDAFSGRKPMRTGSA